MASSASIATIRDMAWLDATRALGYRLVLLAVTLIVAGGWILSAHHGIDARGRPLGTDSLAFWSAARLALAGTPEVAWDLARLYAVEKAAMPVDPGLSSFLYPPPFLLVCWPFGLMPYLVALAVWLTLGVVAFLVAMPAGRERIAAGWGR